MSDTAESIRNNYRNQGAAVERERIIKLIQDSVGNMTAEVIISLIKGEQK